MNLDKFKPVIESYTVEKTIEVVWDHPDGTTDRFRIEALRNHETGKYTTTVYRDTDIVIQPSTLDDHVVDPRNGRVWVNAQFPWTQRDTADAAIEQCLSLIE
ncbi:hypothetical protein ACVWZM_001554 [Bradyrhizobium sp. USDA 4501]